MQNNSGRKISLFFSLKARIRKREGFYGQLVLFCLAYLTKHALHSNEDISGLENNHSPLWEGYDRQQIVSLNARGWFLGMSSFIKQDHKQQQIVFSFLFFISLHLLSWQLMFMITTLVYKYHFTLERTLNTLDNNMVEFFSITKSFTNLNRVAQLQQTFSIKEYFLSFYYHTKISSGEHPPRNLVQFSMPQKPVKYIRRGIAA